MKCAICANRKIEKLLAQKCCQQPNMASVFSGESVVVTKVLLVFHKISPFHINLIFIHIIKYFFGLPPVRKHDYKPEKEMHRTQISGNIIPL